ncbi:Homogentisate 1,2-dioxygenase [Bimuria novae-zelandiae CBS 107.79]|uniref:homogentisate 1,2-dioxygenase n=1 Tax=Bimuria novae-zelandiae CBS 107.79 TaxID=1447943 RepID=A0A6A5V070_9PLEO|nr:Homogentisate 1,2-dioxygenase [Bimuria novae-zelandiae CBS 107.79]
MPSSHFARKEKYRYMNGFNSYHESEANKPYEKIHHIPNQLRWDPFDLDKTGDWLHSLHLVAGAGDPTMKQGLGMYIYAAGKSMDAKEAFYSADGDFLIVPQHSILDIRTEMGRLLVRPNEICVIPRGIKYGVDLPEGPVRGYILELYQGHFQLPELGPIGSNCLANARDFQAPIADFDEDTESEWHVLCKFAGHLFSARQGHTPFDVVAWHGLYYPYKYDLKRFNTIGSVSYDHPDPSIYTVLTAQSDHLGSAVVDFVIFPPRWLYHRNTMSEFMGLIQGRYDAKTGGGFQPAGASLHNVMAGHGPDAATHEKAANAQLQPHKVGEASMAFMLDGCLMVGMTDWGLKKCKKEPLEPRFKRPTPAKIDNGVNGKDGVLGDKAQVPHWTS